jgi:hypothetical protein
MGPGEFTSMVFGCIYVTCFYNSIRLEDVFENVVKGDMLGGSSTVCAAYAARTNVGPIRRWMTSY